MAAQTFNCPNCGAPLDYHETDAATIRCPFCETSVVVPKELRPAQAQATSSVFVTYSAVPKKSGSRAGIIIGILVILFLIAVIGIPLLLAAQTSSNARESALLASTELAVVPAAATLAPPTPVPTLTPTPGFASVALQFGETGIGPGMLNDARYIAVDGNGTLYVADYQGGRIQAFDRSGKYLHQWKVGDQKTIIEGLAANHKGEVFVSFDQDILRFEGETGQELGRLNVPEGGEFGDLASTPDGSLAATWYEGRFGLITSLEGHRDDLVVFTPDAKISLRIPSMISGQTGDLALDNYPTVDGLGNIYVVSEGTIFKFSPQGKYINRFTGLGDQPGQGLSASGIAVDGQGRVYVGYSNQIQVFSPEGRFLDSFKTEKSVTRMVFDEQGGLWVVSGYTVTKYVVNE